MSPPTWNNIGYYSALISASDIKNVESTWQHKLSIKE